MRGEWKTVKLGDITEITSSKRVKMADYVKSGVPFYRSKEIIDLSKGNNISTELFISQSHFKKIVDRFGAPLEGDILLTSVGTLGIPYQVKKNDKFYFKDGNLTWFKNFKNNINSRFLYYWLKSDAAKRRYDEVTIGSTQKALTIIALKSIELQIPSISTQKSVVKILDSLNEKITLNIQTNQTLEALAQALFKSWFVDFDPVKAKQQGGDLDAIAEQLGLSREILDLFPDELVESELGWIPKGWEVADIASEFTVTMGQSPPGESYNENGEGVAFFQGRRDFGWRYPTIRVYCTKPKRMANRGDTLLSVRAPVGDINKADLDCCIGRGLAAIRHKSGCEALTYYSIAELGKKFINYDSEGTVFGSINQKDLKGLKLVKASSYITKEFSIIAGYLDRKINQLSSENQTLTQLRDTLLPKLLSGEITIADVSASNPNETLNDDSDHA